jgi:hypothetical protein
MPKIFINAAIGMLLIPTIVYSKDTSFDLVCPKSIDVSESITKTELGWEAFHDERKMGTHLENVSLYTGHPKDMAALAPNKSSTKNKKLSYLWIFPSQKSYPNSYWVTCDYSNTLITLTKKLPDNLKRCEARGTSLPSGKPLSIDSIHCE